MTAARPLRPCNHRQVGTAWTDPDTRRGWRRYTWNCVLTFLAGVALTFSIDVLTNDAGNPKPGVPYVLVLGLVSLGLFLAMVGIGFLILALRMRRILKQYPWMAGTSTFKRRWGTAFGQLTRFALVTFGEGRDARSYSLMTLRLTWGPMTHDQSLMVCAGPARSGVVATADLKVIAWAQRVDRNVWHL